MYCSKCGFHMPDTAKFCPGCGEKVEWASDVFISDSLETLPSKKEVIVGRAKKIALWTTIVLSVTLIIVLLVYANNYNQTMQQEKEAKQQAQEALYNRYGEYFDIKLTRKGKNYFSVNCEVDSDGELYSYAGNVSFSLFDNGTDNWDISLWDDDIKYSFNKNDNFYYVSLRGGNIAYLIKFTSISEESVKLKIYSYSMGHYGSADSFGQDKETISLDFDEENQCFTFNWVRDWRIYPERLEYDVGEKMGAYPRVEFEEMNPVNPTDYWWFARAR